MPTKPKPTVDLIFESCGGYKPLCERVYIGAREISLAQAHEWLDFDEELKFWAGSVKLRRLAENPFERFQYATERHELFKTAMEGASRTFHWKGCLKDNLFGPMPKRLRGLQRRLNPFNGRDLRERLNEIDASLFAQLIDDLKRPPMSYVTEGRFHYGARQRTLPERYALLHDIDLASFKGRSDEEIARQFCTGTMRRLKDYPREVRHLPTQGVLMPNLFN